MFDRRRASSVYLLRNLRRNIEEDPSGDVRSNECFFLGSQAFRRIHGGGVELAEAFEIGKDVKVGWLVEREGGSAGHPRTDCIHRCQRPFWFDDVKNEQVTHTWAIHVREAQGDPHVGRCLQPTSIHQGTDSCVPSMSMFSGQCDGQCLVQCTTSTRQKLAKGDTGTWGTSAGRRL